MKELLQKKLIEMAFGEHETESQESSLLNGLLGKPVHVETATKYYAGTLVNIDGIFLQLKEAQWVACTGKFSTYTQDGEGDSNAEFEPCPDPLIAIGAICSIIPMPKVIRKLK